MQTAEGGKWRFYSPLATLAMYRNPWHSPLGAGSSPVCREGILGVLRASQTPQLQPCSRGPVPAPASIPFADFCVGSGFRALAMPRVLQRTLECQVCGFWHCNNNYSVDYCPLGLSSGWPWLGQLVFALWRRTGLICVSSGA